MHTKAALCEALLESVEVELCVASAMQSISFADEVLAVAVAGDDVVSMDGVWDAVDHYRHAIIRWGISCKCLPSCLGWIAAAAAV